MQSRLLPAGQGRAVGFVFLQPSGSAKIPQELLSTHGHTGTP